MEHNDIYKIAITKIPKVGPKLIRSLISYCGGLEAVFREKNRNLQRIPLIGPTIANHIRNKRHLIEAEKELKELAKRNIQFYFYLDDQYPYRLKNYDDAPAIFYYKGRFSLNQECVIAIVGSRSPTPYGKIHCARIIEELREMNPILVSGLAYGIDTIVHQTSLAQGLSTVGVLGQGFPMIYPESNRKLAIRMMDNGGIMTEFPLHHKIDARQFPQRNRVIAMLSDAILIIESKKRGGSMITADFGNQYHKDVFALPGRADDALSTGCNHLIKSNQAALVESGEDIAHFMGWNHKSTVKQQKLFIDLSPSERRILEILESEREIELDKLHYLSNFQISELSAILLKLEFDGLIKTLPGKKYIPT